MDQKKKRKGKTKFGKYDRVGDKKDRVEVSKFCITWVIGKGEEEMR